MEEKKEELIAWVKEHKKQLLLAGISFVALIGLILGLKNKEAINELESDLENVIKKTPSKAPEPSFIAQVAAPLQEEVIITRSYTCPQSPVDVRAHIRSLAEGRHHSAAKAAKAAEMGVALLPNETLVDSYTKYEIKRC